MSPLFILKDFIFSAVSAGAFAILFNIPRKEIVHTSVSGAVGWLIYIAFFKILQMETIGVFVGAVSVAFISRVLSYKRLIPSTIYLTPALIPLVPGTEMYYIADGLLRNDMYYTFLHTVRAIKFAGAIALAILILYSVPDRYFNMFRKKNP
ncbi:MAG: threonine/serine exporter family protein [Clostridia bacterium]|jgi:uncharacterized membrane protein YjjB (DUF3815 family)|nr:threonine/serine exporter family protein [Clostridia bacterium]MCI1958333.1 threonine/serine exporter family protein [Clostridia bacterium]MCI2001079.1 threonine/serine exporter family protein [Clostridia bacterium]MCI2015795.1 threonine/serine exporter family protein [Clostridia bacterium]